ncbi:MAG: DUF3987 domain-containing protein [Bacteroidaceae bacterium]|nr:DUF3987 domain-containing protein [Bacteroidaceae bacterium]
MENNTLFQEDFLEEEDEKFPYKLPKDSDLPPLIREVVTNAPKEFKIPSFIACLAPLCCLATRVRVVYCKDSGKYSALLLQVLIVGEQSSGKSYAKNIEELIIGPTLRARDMEQRREEQKYKELKSTASKNKKLPEEPKTTIRQVPPTTSRTMVVKRADRYALVYGEKLTFWMFSDELSAAIEAGKQGFSNLKTIFRTAYDLGSYYGIDFASDNSYSAMVDIIMCIEFCCTPSALDDYMDKKSIEGGNITRCIVCDLEENLGGEAPIFKPYTPEQMVVINQTLQRMMKDTYNENGGVQPEMVIDMSWLDKDVNAWCRKKGKEAAKAVSTTMDTFRKRSSVSAFRVATLCYYLYNGAPDAEKLCRQIYYFMAEYTFQGLMKHWGVKYERLLNKRYEESLPDMPKVSLYDQLPKEFTREQLTEMIKKLDFKTPVRNFLAKWIKNGLIKQSKTIKNTYIKLK